MDGSVGLHEDEQEVAAAGLLTVHQCSAGSPSGPGRHPAQVDLQVESLTG